MKKSPCVSVRLKEALNNFSGNFSSADDHGGNVLDDIVLRQVKAEMERYAASSCVCIEPPNNTMWCSNRTRQCVNYKEKQMSMVHFKSRAEEYLQSAFCWYEYHKRYFRGRLPTGHYASGEIFRMTQSDALRPFLFKEMMRHVYNLSEKNVDHIIEETNHVYNAGAENEVVGHVEMTSFSSSDTVAALKPISPVSNIHMNNIKNSEYLQSQQSVFHDFTFYTCSTSCGANAVKYVFCQTATPELRDDVCKNMNKTCDRLNGLMDNYDRSKGIACGFKCAVKDKSNIDDVAKSVCRILESSKWIKADEGNPGIMAEMLKGRPVGKRIIWIASAPILCHLMRALTGKTKAGYAHNAPLKVKGGIWVATCAYFQKERALFLPGGLNGTRDFSEVDEKCWTAKNRRNDAITKEIYSQFAAYMPGKNAPK